MPDIQKTNVMIGVDQHVRVTVTAFVKSDLTPDASKDVLSEALAIINIANALTDHANDMMNAVEKEQRDTVEVKAES